MKAWTYEADKLLFSNLKDLKGFISHFYHNFLIYPNYHHINIIMIWTLYINVPLYLVFRIFKFSLFSEFRLNIYIFGSESSSDLLCSYYSTVYYIHNTRILKIISVSIPCYPFFLFLLSRYYYYLFFVIIILYRYIKIIV